MIVTPEVVGLACTALLSLAVLVVIGWAWYTTEYKTDHDINWQDITAVFKHAKSKR